MKGGFKIRKWKTNYQSLAQSIASKEGNIGTESKIQEAQIWNDEIKSVLKKILVLA